jgi:hypothetical protein
VANGNGTSFLQRYGWGIVATLIGGLTLAGLSSGARLWSEFTIMQERQDVLTKAVAAHSARLEQSLSSFQHERDLLHLVLERQSSGVKAYESQREALGNVQSMNVEQQYVINALQERVRLLERREAAEDKR